MPIQWKWTIPNILSLIRIAIIPLFVVLYLNGAEAGNMTMQYVSFALLVFSGLTDCLDGWIARRFNQISELGKLLDPIADKLTQVAVLICLATRYQEFLPILFLCTVKEMLQGIGGLILLGKGGTVRASKWFGKIATVVFYSSTALVVLWEGMPNAVLVTLVILTGLSMLFAFLQYARIFRTICKGGELSEQSEEEAALTATDVERGDS